MSAYQEMVESFNRLMYMIKTTAPHLQDHLMELRDKTKALLKENGPLNRPPVASVGSDIPPSLPPQAEAQASTPTPEAEAEAGASSGSQETQ